MANTFLKPTRIVDAGLAVLARDLTLPNLVWNNAAGDFAGAANDTISIRVPAYASAHTRALRSGSLRTRDFVVERKVDVTLSTDIYKDVVITDEQLSLDIVDFTNQVLNPILQGIGIKLEDQLVATMTGATYNTDLTPDGTDPYGTAIDLRTALNNARVPFGGRALVVGSAWEAKMLKDPNFVRASYRGDGGQTLTTANIGAIAGFNVYTSPAIAPDEMYAFHKSAFVLSSRAPIVPAGAPYGASVASDNFAMRVVRVLDSTDITDVLAVDSWVGTNVVTDNGSVNGDGQFIPSDDNAGSDLFVRAARATITP